mmetsp:Transcript_3734/g.10240  ORF Transcript_3734/g.10240 Transcript_3734/m.10240 type:complete len:215 (-) Transcript_3734:940-1584(-)
MPCCRRYPECRFYRARSSSCCLKNAERERHCWLETLPRRELRVLRGVAPPAADLPFLQGLFSSSPSPRFRFVPAMPRACELPPGAARSTGMRTGERPNGVARRRDGLPVRGVTVGVGTWGAMRARTRARTRSLSMQPPCRISRISMVLRRFVKSLSVMRRRRSAKAEENRLAGSWMAPSRIARHSSPLRGSGVPRASSYILRPRERMSADGSAR